MFSDLKRIIDQISRDKGIERNLLVEAIEDAVLSAAKKKFGSRRDLEVRFNEELGEVEVFQFRTVVETVEDEQTQISLQEATSLDPEVQLNDDIGSKQVIIQKMKDAERDVIYDLYKDRKGEVVNGIVQRFERGNIIVNLGRTDAILPLNEQMPRRSYRQGDRIRAYLIDVRHTSRDPQLVLSRICNEFLSKLFHMEVPEISEGIVKIMGVCREPGSRAKIAVTSTESDVDPVGACVGMKGSRVQNVVQELQGEKIDIVPWSPDPARFVSNALAPAQISLVVVDEEKKTLLVVAPDDQLSLAIGRQGQNVRLASMLLGWRIDVKSEQKYSKFIEEGYQSMLELANVNDKLADILHDNGYTSVQELAVATPEDLVQLKDIDEARAEVILSQAREAVEAEKLDAEKLDAEKQESAEPESDSGEAGIENETSETDSEKE
ncbi:transcription termination factor NusA [Thermodesulfobacteriota bacterium]